MSLRDVRAAARAAAFLGVVGFLIVTYPIACAFGLAGRHAVRRFWSRFTCWLFGIRVAARGAAFGGCPTLLVPNHVSYFDVVILGSFTDATFVAKSEVDRWPLLGYIARVTGTLFIRRHWREALVQRDAIAGRMRDGESFVLFPEGTSSDGLGVKPFKTSLLSVVEPWVPDRPVAAQAVTVTYLRLADGTPYSRRNCDLYAWYDEMEFLPHIWEALRGDGCEVEVEFHEPVLSWAVDSRKVLGPAMRTAITEHLAARRRELIPGTETTGEAPPAPGSVGPGGSCGLAPPATLPQPAGR